MSVRTDAAEYPFTAETSFLLSKSTPSRTLFTEVGFLNAYPYSALAPEGRELSVKPELLRSVNMRTNLGS